MLWESSAGNDFLEYSLIIKLQIPAMTVSTRVCVLCVCMVGVCLIVVSYFYRSTVTKADGTHCVVLTL